MSDISTISEIINNFLKLGINLSDQRLTLLKWRLSDEGKKYYNHQENVDFYKALSKGKTKTIDIIRKEKQQRISEMLKKIPLSILMILLLIFSTSCSTIGVPERLDESFLKSTEKTYQLKEQEIKTEDGITKVDNNWYMIHKDLVVTYNENQDNLIKSLQLNINQQNEIKKIESRLNTTYLISTISIVILIISFLILLIIYLFKRKK